jgi:5-methylcytosine-specific restriction protein A
MPIMYKCSFKGCSKILEIQGLCDIHQSKADIVSKQRYKVYQTNRLMDKEQKKYHTFYGSKGWLMSRDTVIANCYGMDVIEYYRTGKIIEGYTVHHIEPLDACWELRLDTNNLIYLNESNHKHVHREYNKGDREKKAMQRILLELKKKFIEEYGT